MKLALAFIMILVLMLGGCPSGSTTPPATTPIATTTTTGQTAGQLSSAGQAVFSTRCAGCHGSSGQGVTAPAVIGASAGLTKYATAQGLFNYISANMPGNAPGSLSQQQYLEVTAYLLVQNNLVAASALLGLGLLGGISLS